MLTGDSLDLLGLLADHVRNVLNLGIDELLVGLVDKRSAEKNTIGQQSKAPERHDLDQVV